MNQKIETIIKSEKIMTPCYIADIDRLHLHVKKMKDIANGKVDYCYAMKANPFLIKHMDKLIGKIEVCSPGELKLCIENGIPGEHIIFSGVNKTAADIKEAIEYGVEVVTLESVRHFELAKEYCEQNNKKIKVLPRLSSGAQFGMTENSLRKIIAERAQYSNLDIIGIHYFSGTQKKKIEKDFEEIDAINELIKNLYEEYAFECKLFEYGAGLSVPYFEGEDFDGVYDDLTRLVKHIEEKDVSYTITLELGRFFAFNSMVYVTTVDDVKRASDTNICLVDGGIHHLNYYGQNMAMRVPKLSVIREKNGDTENPSASNIYGIDDSDPNWRICGSLCTFADVLVRKATLGQLAIGDKIVFYNAGAYSITEAPALFLSRRLPNIYQLENDRVLALRNNKESYCINMGD